MPTTTPDIKNIPGSQSSVPDTAPARTVESVVPDTGPARTARIEVLRDGGRPSIRVTVPAGTRLEKTFQLRDKISEIARHLSGCSACNSGVPLFIREADLVEQVIRVDLKSMAEIH